MGGDGFSSQKPQEESKLGLVEAMAFSALSNRSAAFGVVDACPGLLQ